MAWTAPMTAVANAVFTASEFNTYVRDNLNATATAKVSSAGQYVVATGANVLAARTPAVDSVTDVETTTSTSFTDLATTGPSVTSTTGTRALVVIYARLVNNTGGSQSYASFEVSGASTIAGDDTRALIYESSNANDNIWASAVFLRTGLTSGSNTFKMVYRVNGGTGSFADRRLTILPF